MKDLGFGTECRSINIEFDYQLLSVVSNGEINPENVIRCCDFLFLN